MPNNLFPSIVFGPIKSRRLGTSLGINLLPTTIKFCTFNCVYCECGWTETFHIPDAGFFSVDDIAAALEEKLVQLKKENLNIDSITFSGNGEPTSHPHFPEIIKQTIQKRDSYYPKTMITVLSNSSMAGDEKIREALMKVNNIMKLDAGFEATFHHINLPKTDISLIEIVENLKKFTGQLSIQTMFLRGQMGDISIDNTTATEVDQWLKYVAQIQPRELMIYSLDRLPPLSSLQKVSWEELNQIAELARNMGIKTKVY